MRKLRPIVMGNLAYSRMYGDTDDDGVILRSRSDLRTQVPDGLVG